MDPGDNKSQVFLQEALSLFSYAQQLRRDIHRYPEIGFKEFRTSGIVTQELKSIGLALQTGIAETGVVALIEGGHPGPVVMLRFDMDALPIEEETGVEYASQNHGIMHACGHDGHVAIGLTVARLLARIRGQLSGSIKLVFQPAEEGLGGAKRMIAEGVLDDPQPDFVLGIHIWNEKPFGWIGLNSAPMMAAGDILKIDVIGKGGHGAQPHLAVDPLVASAHIVIGLQNIVARNISPLQAAVVSVTMIHGGEAFNVIPSQVNLQGTVRTFERSVREEVISRIQQILDRTAEAFNCQSRLEIQSLTPAVINDPIVAEHVRNTIYQILPESQIDAEYRTMGSEDMACFLEKIPGCFFFIGSANAELGLNAPHHHPAFNFDESVLPQAAAVIAAAAVDLLKAGD